MTYPNSYDQILFTSVNQAFEMGAVAVGATIYFWSEESGSQVQADIVKQKQPTNNGGFKAVGFGRTHEKVYSELTSNHPIDLTRYQVINCFLGRSGLINSGGSSSGKSDLADAVRTAVINKRAGGMGLISGRKAFQRPLDDGIQLLNTLQAVYLSNEVTVA